LFAFSCGGNTPFFFEDDYSSVPDAYSTTGITPDTTQTGLIIYVIAEGDTSSPLDVGIRDVVKVFYTGRTINGEVFDSSFKNDQTFSAQFTVANLIDGFTEGLLEMKEGGKRVLVIPPSLAYEGTTNALRNDTLVFDIELETIIF
tara:strand:+ start:3992 stop:4426 length:435 start_codon:yes stop_codon:yes gene_type:complete